jgi:hypothetical protein
MKIIEKMHYLMTQNIVRAAVGSRKAKISKIRKIM